MSDILSILNNAGIGQHLGSLQRALLLGATNMILGVKDPKELEKDPDRLFTTDPLFLLNSVGPAAASDAVEYAIGKCKSKGLFRDIGFTHNFVNNVRMIQNDDGCRDFNSVLRQFLLPRYAYLDFDNLVDPRHQVDQECGYPKFITPIMYRYMYDRDDVAKRVVDIYSDESWAADPCVYETESETEWTPFELRWRELCDDYNLLQMLYRIDKLAGIGHYGALLVGVDDGQDLEAPIEEAELLRGTRRSISSKQRNLLYMRPFDEYLSFIHMYETDVMSPRYGLPKMYNLVFLDMTIDAAGASIGTRLNRRVHWSRVVHVADNLQSSLVFGVPRQQPVFNRLLDLRKIKGGSAEMFWKGAFPGISFEIDPRFVADDLDFDKDKLRREVEDYANGLQRYLTTLGVKAVSLAPQVADPRNHVMVQIEAIASHSGCPTRIFMGSEEARLASAQDKLTWNLRLRRTLKTFREPNIIRNVIDRFIAIGIMPPPSSGRYYVGWNDLNTVTDEDKANLALKWTQALSQYVATGIIHLMGIVDYLTIIMGLQPRDAIRINEAVEAGGGLKKLLGVDPAQGAGVNGKRENIAGQHKSPSQGGDVERDTNDKKSEGMTS